MSNAELMYVDTEVRWKTLLTFYLLLWVGRIVEVRDFLVEYLVPDWIRELLSKPSPPPPPGLLRHAKVRAAPGEELTRLVRMAILSKLTMLIEGPPGVGKTYTTLEVLRELTKQRRIKGFVFFSCTKSLTPDQVWQPELIMMTDASGKLQIISHPPEWQQLLGDNFVPLMTATPDQLRELDKLENTIIVFIDEASRASQTMLDSVLTPIESRVVQINGRQVVAPGLKWILSGNSPGMDQTATSYSPALTSRFDLQLTLTNPDLGTLVHYIETSIREKVDASDGLRPSHELIAIAAGICQLLGGWPLTRACYAEAPQQVLQLVQRAVELDPQLKAKLEKWSELSTFPPDARKPGKWLINCINGVLERATGSGKTGKVTAADLVEWSAFSLSPGVRKKFASGVKPQKQRVLDDLIAEIVALVFESPALCNLILNASGPQAAAENVVSALVRRDQRAAALPRVRRVLTNYRRGLIEASVPDAENHFTRFVATVTRLPQALTGVSPKRHGEKVLARARAEQWLVGNNGVLFSTLDRELLQELSQTPGLHDVGLQVMELAYRRLYLPEWVRHSLLQFPLAAEFEPEIMRVSRRNQAIARLLPQAAEVVEALLRPDAARWKVAVQNALTCINKQGWERSELDVLCRLLSAIRRAADRSFGNRFASLVQHLNHC
jgi:MoxR-like ATPase